MKKFFKISNFLLLLMTPLTWAATPNEPILTTARLTWDSPVSYVNDDPLPRCADVALTVTKCLDSFRIYHGIERELSPEGVIGYVLDQPVIEVDETLLAYTVFPAVEGRWFFAMTAVDREGNESAESNHESKLIAVIPLPLPPVILQQAMPVFTMIKQPDRFLLLPIGTVPAGTSCDPNNSVNGHGVVPNAAVVWTCTNEITCPRPIVVVALCDG